MPTEDEPRKKRGAENQLTQNNWEKEEDEEEVDRDGGFAKASSEELAKRKIVKARRSGKPNSNCADNPSATAEASESKPAAPSAFSWTSPAKADAAASTPTSEIKASDSEKKDLTQDRADVKKVEDVSNSTDTSSPAKPLETEKKPLFSFPSGTTGFGGFGSSSGFTGFGFGSAAASSSGVGGTSFGSFGSSSQFSFSFSNAPSQVDAFKAKKKEDGEDGPGEDGEEGGGEDNEKEVAVEKTCQLEEVETCTGEEDEDNVFQVRGKLFIFSTPEGHAKEKGAFEDSAAAESADASDKSATKDKDTAGKEAQPSWVVIGIGNLKLNVPKEGASRRPRIVMRRQKTFQVCLNTYLFETMICDKAGPKDIRFTGMRMNAETGQPEAELATYLLRVKDEEQADEFVSHVHRHKNK